jgi:hypothetical protein
MVHGAHRLNASPTWIRNYGQVVSQRARERIACAR